MDKSTQLDSAQFDYERKIVVFNELPAKTLYSWLHWGFAMDEDTGKILEDLIPDKAYQKQCPGDYSHIRKQT